MQRTVGYRSTGFFGYAVIDAALPQRLWTRGAALVSVTWGGGIFAGSAVGGIFAQFGAWRLAFGVLVVAALATAALVPRALAAHTGEATDPSPVPALSLTLLTTAALVVSIAGVVSSIAITAVVNTVQLIAYAFGAALAGVLVNLGKPSTLRSAQLLLFIFAALAFVGVAAAARSQRERGSPVRIRSARPTPNSRRDLARRTSAARRRPPP
ncbi:MAG: hypothetical protein WBQ44_20060 [Rhodococcus sp. (in: high G+C Gram-positive bacteria)]